MDQAHIHVAESLAELNAQSHFTNKERGIELHRLIVDPMSAGSLPLRRFLLDLSPEDRWILLRCATGSFRNLLIETTSKEGLEVRPVLRDVKIPNLPQALHETLAAYVEKRRRYFQARIDKGHDLDDRVLQTNVREAVRYCKFLGARGIHRWDAVNLNDRIEYAATRHPRAKRELDHFLAFIEGKKRIRKSGSGQRKKNQATVAVLRSGKPLRVLDRHQIKARLEDAKARLSCEEYALYWLVAKFGITVTVARNLTLDRITKTADGSIVIRPAEAWCQVPPSIGSALAALAQKMKSEWPFTPPESAPPLPFLAEFLGATNTKKIFQSEAQLLRASAIVAAMRGGMLNRKTLTAMTGVSGWTLREYEFLLSSDIHTFVSKELAEKRNASIRGSDQNAE